MHYPLYTAPHTPLEGALPPIHSPAHAPRRCTTPYIQPPQAERRHRAQRTRRAGRLPLGVGVGVGVGSSILNEEGQVYDAQVDLTAHLLLTTYCFLLTTDYLLLTGY